MTNMKNVQHHVNYSKIIILKELLVITHPKTGSRIKLTRTDSQKNGNERVYVVNKTYKHLWVLCFCELKVRSFNFFCNKKLAFLDKNSPAYLKIKLNCLRGQCSEVYFKVSTGAPGSYLYVHEKIRVIRHANQKICMEK